MAINSSPYRTGWQRKSRLNTESDLKFSGTNHVNCITDDRYNLGTRDWAFSFLNDIDNTSTGWFFALNDASINVSINLIFNSGGIPIRAQIDPSNNTLQTFDFSPSGFVNIDKKSHVVLQRKGTEIELYINSVFIPQDTAFNLLMGDEFDLSGVNAKLNIGASTVGTTSLDGKENNFYVFCDHLTQLEISYMHANGGDIPDSANSKRIANYPLTERFAFKADAAFVAKHPQFIVGDNVFFDAIEQDNYAKPYAYDNQNPLLADFTQSGTPIVANGSDGDGNYLEFEYSGNVGGDALQTVDLVPIVNGADYRIEIDMKFTVVSSAVTYQVTFEGSSNNTPTEEVYGTSLFKLTYEFTASGGTTNRNFRILMFGPNGSQAGDTVRIYGIRISRIGFVPRKANHGKAVNFTDAELGTGGDVRTQTVKKEFYDPKGTNVWYNGAGDPNPSNMTEISSGFVPILDALLMQTGNSIGKSYTNIVGFGFTIQVLTDITALTDIITGIPAITGYYFNGNKLNNATELIDAINLNELCHIDLEFAISSPTITFVHTGIDYNLIRDYYVDEQLSLKEKKELTNNILFSNPVINIQSKFNYYALHNESNYVAGATEPENVPLIGTGNRESLGWAGGDAATKLADLASNLSLISSLR